MTEPNDAVVKKKARLRADALARRNALDPQARAMAAATVGERTGIILDSLLPKVVSFYWPIGSECATDGLIARAYSAGMVPALPVTIDEREIRFRRFRPGDPLVAGRFGTSEPSGDAPFVEPDVIVVPVVAFDRAGGRLGYGRGYYDRAITALRQAGFLPKLIGVAFSVQEVTEIPVEPHDVRLDWVVSEHETIAVGER